MIGATGGVVWLIIAAVFFLCEGLTVQLVSVWFAIGSLFAALASAAGLALWLQLLIFLLTSVAVLVVGRPFLMERVRRGKVPTNSDRVIGQVGVVIEQVDNVAQTGRIHVDGLDWAARSEQGDVIPVDTKVIVGFIDGVKLIVRPVRQPSEPRIPAVETDRQPPQ